MPDRPKNIAQRSPQAPPKNLTDIVLHSLTAPSMAIPPGPQPPQLVIPPDPCITSHASAAIARVLSPPGLCLDEANFVTVRPPWRNPAKGAGPAGPSRQASTDVPPRTGSLPPISAPALPDPFPNPPATTEASPRAPPTARATCRAWPDLRSADQGRALPSPPTHFRLTPSPLSQHNDAIERIALSRTMRSHREQLRAMKDRAHDRSIPHFCSESARAGRWMHPPQAADSPCPMSCPPCQTKRGQHEVSFAV